MTHEQKPLKHKSNTFNYSRILQYRNALTRLPELIRDYLDVYEVSDAYGFRVPIGNEPNVEAALFILGATKSTVAGYTFFFIGNYDVASTHAGRMYIHTSNLIDALDTI